MLATIYKMLEMKRLSEYIHFVHSQHETRQMHLKGVL